MTSNPLQSETDRHPVNFVLAWTFRSRLENKYEIAGRMDGQKAMHNAASYTEGRLTEAIQL